MFKLTPFTSTPRKQSDFVDFYDVLDDFFTSSPLRSMRHDTFKIDVKEEDNAYLIEADLPGIDKKELKVNYDDQTLNIEVSKEETKEEKDEKDNYLHRERSVHSMQRSIKLLDVDPAKIKARLQNGVLQVIAEKQEVQNQGYVIDVE